MSHTPPSRTCRQGRSLLLALAALAAGAGCQRDPFAVGVTVPVEGTVLVHGRPLRLGPGAFARAWFYPDTARGNACPQVPVGDVDDGGHYRLGTRSQAGAPPGWYRVMVLAVAPGASGRRGRRSLVSRRYAAVETSGLTVQVIADAPTAGYDLKLRP